jgi:ligand-binding SRPBCC domain-containing protein
MGNELVVERRTSLSVSAGDAWRWHAEPGWGAFERLTPPWRRVTMLEHPAALADGARVTFRIAAGPFSVRWVAEHRDVRPGSGFVDFQVDGPFERWVHQHGFEAQPDGTAVLHDRIACVPPLGLRIGSALVERELRRMLAYRHALTVDELAMHAGVAQRPRIHVAVTGASGLLGSALVPALSAGGHRVTRIVRGVAGPGEISWDPAVGRLDPADLTGVDAVVHLNCASPMTRSTRSCRPCS